MPTIVIVIIMIITPTYALMNVTHHQKLHATLLSSVVSVVSTSPSFSHMNTNPLSRNPLSIISRGPTDTPLPNTTPTSPPLIAFRFRAGTLHISKVFIPRASILGAVVSPLLTPVLALVHYIVARATRRDAAIRAARAVRRDFNVVRSILVVVVHGGWRRRCRRLVELKANGQQARSRLGSWQRSPWWCLQLELAAVRG